MLGEFGRRKWTIRRMRWLEEGDGVSEVDHSSVLSSGESWVDRRSLIDGS